jgi:O-antigen/teichoic acid export membrane protein
MISNTTLIILLFGNLAMSFSGNTYIYLLMTNKGKIMGKILLVAVIINLILNYFLIPKFGIEGAAISSIVSVVFWNFAGALYVNQVDKINILFRK